MRWRLRTSFGDQIVVVRAFDARKGDEARRVPAVFMRSELREWLVRRRHSFERDALIQMYRELRGDPTAWRHGGERDLLRFVLPVLEEAFAHGRLVAFEQARSEVPAILVPLPQAEAEAGGETGPTDWVEIIVTDDEGEPYRGPYRLDLPDGRTVSGQLDMGGAVRVDGIPGGSCIIVLPELHVPLERTRDRA